MTEKSPPPGKVWVTVEVDQGQWNNVAPLDLWELDHIDVDEGPEPESPSDKCNRLLLEAERLFRDASIRFQPFAIADGSGPDAMARGVFRLAEALKVFREEL